MNNDMSSYRTPPIETALFDPRAVISAEADSPTCTGEDGSALETDQFDSPCVVGRYRIKEEIGRGGMGIVLRAYDELLHRDLAIKLLLKSYLDQQEIIDRFVDEALLTSQLQHPCIVPVYDRGVSCDSRPFFAMKLVSGQSLAAILSNGSGDQQDRLRLLKTLEAVCQTVAYSHSCGVLHLDIKPSNIMIGEFGEVYLMDWGLAKIWLPDNPSPKQLFNERSVVNTPLDNHSQPYSTGGTPAYMSPEQACGDPVCPKSDVFGLGGTLCEILTGRPPYRGNNIQGIHSRAIRGRLEDAMCRLDDCKADGKLVELAKGCLECSLENRISSAKEVASSISQYLETALVQAESDICRFFDLSLDLFCIATLDGYFDRVNINFSRVLGYSSEALKSRPFLDFIHSEDVEDTLQVMKDLTAGQQVVHFCNRYRHADGHYLTLEWTAKPFLQEGSIFAVARDVTNRFS
jgi:serine/threonine-protein kinase